MEKASVTVVLCGLSILLTHFTGNRYCKKQRVDFRVFLKEADVPDFKIFWEWALDKYPGLRAASTLQNYWRVLRMYMREEVGRQLSELEQSDVRNVSNPDRSFKDLH